LFDSNSEVAPGFPEGYFAVSSFDPDEDSQPERSSGAKRGSRPAGRQGQGRRRPVAQRSTPFGAVGDGADTDGDASAAAKPVNREKLEQRAKNVILHQLSRQAKSRFQLAEVLAAREIPDDIAAAALDRLTEAGLIDDQAFANTIASTRRATRGLSTASIRRELIRKGVAEEHILIALSAFTAEEELETAIKFASKRLRTMQHLEPEVRRRRLLGFLARKGYGGGVAYQALRAAEADL